MARDQSWIADLLGGLKKVAFAAVDLPNRDTINFASGFTVVDNPLTGATDVTAVASVVGGQNAVTLANGLNSNIATVGLPTIRITGPSAAFSIGGFAPAGGASWIGGQTLVVTNTTTQAMTIVNESSSSTTTNRITTPSGVNVVLPAQKGGAAFVYDGTTSRWVLQHIGVSLPTRLHIRDFGAKGDFSTDDSAAINACITAAVAIGATVFIDPSSASYLCRSNINVPSWARIEGAGANSVIALTNGAAVTLTGAANVWMEGFRVRSFDNTCPYGIKLLNGCSYVTLHKIIVSSGAGGFTTAGIYATAVTGSNNTFQLNMYDVQVSSCAGDGIRIQDDLTQSTNLVNVQCIFNFGYGLNQLHNTATSLTDLSQIHAFGCLFDTNGLGAINSEMLGASAFVGCHFEQPKAQTNDLIKLANRATYGGAKGVTFHECFFNGGSSPKLVNFPFNTGNIANVTFEASSFYLDDNASPVVANCVTLAGCSGFAIRNCYIPVGGTGTANLSWLALSGSVTGVDVQLGAFTSSVTMAGATDLTISPNQDKFWPATTVSLTGSLTSPTTLTVPLGDWRKTIANNTGAVITVIGASGTGVALPNGKTATCWSDGTNVYSATSLTSYYTECSTVACGNDTTEDTLKTFNVPQGGMAANSVVRVRCSGTSSGAGGNKSIRLYFGGSNIFNLTFAVNPDVWTLEAEIANNNATNTQFWSYKLFANHVLQYTNVGTLAINTATTSPQVKVTGQKVSAGDVFDASLFVVEVLP